MSAEDTLAFNFATEAAEATSYEEWLGFTNWQNADSSRAADPDKDGNSNLEEFFFGQDPLIPQTRGLSTFLSSSFESGQTVELFARAANQGINLEVLYSTDLKTWTPIQDLTWLDSTPELDSTPILTESGQKLYKLHLGENTGFFKLKFTEK